MLDVLERDFYENHGAMYPTSQVTKYKQSTIAIKKKRIVQAIKKISCLRRLGEAVLVILLHIISISDQL